MKKTSLTILVVLIVLKVFCESNVPDVTNVMEDDRFVVVPNRRVTRLHPLEREYLSEPVKRASVTRWVKCRLDEQKRNKDVDFDITELSIQPAIVKKGSKVRVRFKSILSRGIVQSGKLEIGIFRRGQLMLAPFEHDICKLAESSKKSCPIHPAVLSGEFEQEVPSVAFSGDYDAQSIIFVDGLQTACIQFKFKIV